MPEHTQAKRWREAHGLSREKLAELTGFSRETIYWYEQGVQPPSKTTGGGNKTPKWIMQRFKLACSGVDQFLRTGEKFDWGE